MRLSEKWNGLYLEGIVREEIYYTNLRGEKKGNSIYAPTHDYGLWISDSNILNAFNEAGVKVSASVDEQNPEIVRYSVNFRAYPSVKQNKVSGAMVQYPKVMLKGSEAESYIPLDEAHFAEADTKRVKQVNMRFHLWNTGTNVIAAIDELWIELDPFATGPVDDDYFSQKFGMVPPVEE